MSIRSMKTRPASVDRCHVPAHSAHTVCTFAEVASQTGYAERPPVKTLCVATEQSHSKHCQDRGYASSAIKFVSRELLRQAQLFEDFGEAQKLFELCRNFKKSDLRQSFSTLIKATRALTVICQRQGTQNLWAFLGKSLLCATLLTV